MEAEGYEQLQKGTRQKKNMATGSWTDTKGNGQDYPVIDVGGEGIWRAHIPCFLIFLVSFFFLRKDFVKKLVRQWWLSTSDCFCSATLIIKYMDLHTYIKMKESSFINMCVQQAAPTVFSDPNPGNFCGNDFIFMALRSSSNLLFCGKAVISFLGSVSARM